MICEIYLKLYGFCKNSSRPTKLQEDVFNNETIQYSVDNF